MLHTNLRCLASGDGLAEYLLPLIHMPFLETLEIDTWGVRGNSASLRMITALSTWPSPCRLEEFEIQGIDYAEEISSLRGALRVLPMLRRLCFNRVDFSNKWWPTDISTLCPQLTTLQFNGCAGLTGKDLLSTVQHRSEGDAGKASIGLIEIHVPLQRMEVDEGTQEALRAIVELRFHSRSTWPW